MILILATLFACGVALVLQGTILSGTLGAVLGADAQEDTAKKNLQAARETNDLNYRMFQEGRGSTGHAFLPTYFGDSERDIANDALGFYNQSKSLLGSPADQFARYRQALDRYNPIIDAATGTVEDVYNGNLTNNRLEYLRPVNEARTNMARTRRESIFEALRERINALNADNARKGFSGTGSFAQNRLLGATIGARQGAAGEMSGAKLANAQDTRGVMDQGANLRLQMLDRPYQQATQALNLEMLPLNQVQANFSRALQPFEFFRMSPQGFRADPLPMQPYTPSAAQIALTGAGAANQQIGNYFAQQNMAKQYGNALGNAQLANAYSSGAGTSPATYDAMFAEYGGF
jgi:hypothetical protein